ncbi:MAG: S-layer homology domain-containing protein [Janthinobacterium lividum]
MKKSLILLAGASMAFIGLPAVTHAQAASGPFADVPTDHWAYQSVDTLQKAGIVIGYPDGTYGGRRPMTRYEFAVAIARLLAQMKTPGVTAGDLSTLRSDLENQIAGNKAAIDALTALVNGFGPELTRLGVDVAAADARLDALEARLGRDEGILGAVKNEQDRFKVTGEVNIIGEADASRRRNGDAYTPFRDQNGVYQGNTGTGDRLLQSSDVYEDILLHLRGKLSDTTTANVDLDFGNYLSQVGNTAAFPGYSAGSLAGSSLTPGTLTAGNQYANVYKAYLDAAVKLGPLGGAELLVGRFGNQYTKYTLKQADADIYTNLTQTDSGDFIGDGAGVNLKLGPAHVNAFAVKMSADQFSEPYGGSAAFTPTAGNPFSAANAQARPGGLIASNHAAALDQGYGVRATFGAPEAATLGFTLEQFGLSNNNIGGTSALNGTNGLGVNDGLTDPNASGSNAQFNRLTVYGADFNGALPFGLPGVKKGGLLIDASYTVSAQGFNQGFNNVGNGFRYSSTDDQIGAAFGGLTLKGGYQYVGPDFSAPGYWGRVGAWTNPTNVRGPVVSAKFAFTPKLSLNADYEEYKAAYGTNKNGTLVDSPLQQDDHLNRYQVGFNYGLSSAYGVDLGYEDVKYDLRNENGTLAAAGQPHETYVNIGIGHTISNNASIKLLYQIVHYDDKGTGFDSVASGGKEDGGVAVGQFQLKF